MRITRTILTIVTVAAALAASPAAAQETTKPAQITLRLAADPDRVLQVQPGSAYADKWGIGDWTGSDDELFEPLDKDGAFNFRSVSNGYCSHLPVLNGGSVTAWDCEKSERWAFQKVGNGYQVVDQRRGNCLASAGDTATTLPCSATGTEADVWLPVWEPND